MLQTYFIIGNRLSTAFFPVGLFSYGKNVDTYLKKREYPNLRIYPYRIGITLTKKRYIKQKYPSITWNNIINILADFNTAQNRICQQYLNFLTGIDKNMNYYEEEVISVPAGGTMKLVEQFEVYICPDTPYYNYPSTSPLEKTGK